MVSVLSGVLAKPRPKARAAHLWYNYDNRQRSHVFSRPMSFGYLIQTIVVVVVVAVVVVVILQPESFIEHYFRIHAIAMQSSFRVPCKALTPSPTP